MGLGPGLGLGNRIAFTIAQDPGYDQEQAIVKEGKFSTHLSKCKRPVGLEDSGARAKI